MFLVVICVTPSVAEEEGMVLGCHSFRGCSVELWVIVEFENPRIHEHFFRGLFSVVEVVESSVKTIVFAVDV